MRLCPVKPALLSEFKSKGGQGEFGLTNLCWFGYYIMRANKSWFESPKAVAPQLGSLHHCPRAYSQPALNFFEEEEEACTPQHEQHFKRLPPPSTTTSQRQLQPFQFNRPIDTGLRSLSGRVLSIVKQKPHCTFQQVAGVLLHEIRKAIDVPEASNQELNIKRRIYDSINVFLSIGIIRKDQGRISFIPAPEEAESYQEWVRTKQMYKLGKLRRNQLKKKVEEAREKERGIKRLLQRNRQGNQRRGQRVQFPLVGMELQPGWKVVRCERGVTEVLLRQTEPVKPFGDLDCLRWLPQL